MEDDATSLPAAPRAPHQLPSGRHGLPRAFVISNQRERVLDAVMQVAVSRGYAKMRVDDVITVAGVSRRTFYEHFANKEEAFLAAYDLVAQQLISAVSAAYDSGSESWPAKIGRGLGAFLRLLADEPGLAHICIVEVLAAGPAVLSRRAAAMQRFEAFLEPGLYDGPHSAAVPALLTEAVIGGTYDVIYSRVVGGHTEALPALLPELLYTILVPFVGSEVAAAESARAQIRTREAATV
jgi:AcrR family transcriptional regulator